MIVTITGPRSVGKTTISKIVARKLKLKYISSDKIGNRTLKKQGGLDKAIKSGKMKEIIKKRGYPLIIREYKKKDFVFDLSGGSFANTDFPKASEEVRCTAKSKSIVVGLLPFKNKEKSIKTLFRREKERPHLKKSNPKELLNRTRRRYNNFSKIFKAFCDFIIYTEDKTPNKIAQEIIEKSGL